MIRQALTIAMTGVALMALSSPSRSADVVEPVYAEPGRPWTGFHVGLHGGAAFGSNQYTLLGAPDVTYRLNDETLIFGIHAGYDHQFAGSWVAGAELSATYLNSDIDDPFFAGNALFEADWSFSASGRLGYLVTPDTLFYGRLGYSALAVSGELGFFGEQDDIVDAVLVGVGIETFLSDRITGRIEAAYLRPVEDFVIAADGEVFDPRFLTVTAGLSYRFGAPSNAATVRPAPVMDWQGFYAGIHGSYNFASAERTLNGLPDVGPFSDETAGVGAHIGYDFRVGSSSLLGVELDATWLQAQFDDPAGGALPGVTEFATIEAMGAATVRAGYVVSPSTLLYLKGGLAGIYTTSNEDFFGLGAGGDELLPAYQVGAGIETALSEKLSLRVEGLYTKAFDDLEVNNAGLGQFELKPSLLTAKVGLSYHF